MKLKNRLFINFTVLFFILLNLFGYFLIQTIFIDSIEKAVDNGYREYAVIYSNLKSGENMNRLFFTDKDIIRIKNNSYLKNAGTYTLDLEVRDMDNNIIYTTMGAPYTMPQGMDNFAYEDATNYVITTNNDTHELIINKKITLGDEKYYLSYINNIEVLYKEKVNYFLVLLMFNIIAGIISIFVIYYFANEITKPLYSFIKNINEIINKNYSSKLKKESNIEEINILTDSFNIMNDEISLQISILEKQNQEKQRFIDSLTHEIRTPLTSIIGYSSLYLNKDISNLEAIKTSFKNIYQNGKRIESLTENLIKLITLDKSNLDITEISILKILNDIKNNLNTTLYTNNIDFKIIGEDIIIISDEYLLNTLFSNFIDNAIKATKNKEYKKINIIIKQNTVIIGDNGKGIPKNDLNKIFEPFFMVDKSRKRTISGFGLGLSICHSIMKILNIKFDIESQEGVGTKIILTFDGGSHEEL